MRSLITYYLQAHIPDISSADTIIVPVPDGGEIIELRGVLEGAITVGDAAVTFELNGTAITGSAMTVAYSGSAKGDEYVTTPTALNVAVRGDYIEVITDGGSTDAQGFGVTIAIRR